MTKTKTKTKTVTVQERIRQLRAEHGTYRAAADATGISFVQLYALATGRAKRIHIGRP